MYSLRKWGEHDEQKWGKNGEFFVLTILLTALFALASGNASAEETTPAVSVTGKFADTITIVNVTNNEGGNLNWDLEQWATFRINATYDLAVKMLKQVTKL